MASMKRSALSLNNENRPERSGSTSSKRTNATQASVSTRTSDFWNRLSQQMSYIDGSTHSSSILDDQHLRGTQASLSFAGPGDHFHLHNVNDVPQQGSSVDVETSGRTRSNGLAVKCNFTTSDGVDMLTFLPAKLSRSRHNSLSGHTSLGDVNHRELINIQQVHASESSKIGAFSYNSTMNDESSLEEIPSDSPPAIRSRSVSCNQAPDLLCFEELQHVRLRSSFPEDVHQHHQCQCAASAKSAYEFELENWHRAVNTSQNSCCDQPVAATATSTARSRTQDSSGYNNFISGCDDEDDDDDDDDDDYYCIVDDEREEDAGVGGGAEGKEDLEMGLLQPVAGNAAKVGKTSKVRYQRSGTIPMSASAVLVTSTSRGGRNVSKEIRKSHHKYYQPHMTRGNGMFFDNHPFASYGTYEVPRKKASSWEESSTIQRRQSLMIAASLDQCSAAGGNNLNLPPGTLLMPIPSELDLHLHNTDLRYYFQHPYPRLFVTYFVIFCNFLLFAEDPISHSHTESDIPMVGNVFSFVVTKYTPEWRWTVIKVLMWILAMLCGMIFGKLIIHGYLFGRLLRLKMFRDDQGSWMTMFMTVIVSLYVFSHIYNVMLFLWYPNLHYQITSQMGVTNSSVMKAAACGTWLGDLITALMVTDMMLQDTLYPHWATWFRRIWRKSNVPRILIFWVGSVLATSVVVTLIVSDWISWDKLNKDFISTNEISRAFLASFILVMDLLIVMQDWDFPNFTTTLHVNLPGMNVATLKWKYAAVNITGKWFNYGIIFLVMMLDLNMWKNQIFYSPKDYGQYTGPDDKVRTVNEQEVLTNSNTSQWTWETRSRQFNMTTGRFAYEDDVQMNSRYMGYPLSAKWSAFIPSVIGLVMLVTLVTLYGRFPSSQSHPRDRPVDQCRDLGGKQQELLYCEKNNDQVT